MQKNAKNRSRSAGDSVDLPLDAVSIAFASLRAGLSLPQHNPELTRLPQADLKKT